MTPLKARVQKGRLLLDEPTTRPEGEVVELVPLDEILASGGDYLDREERSALHEELEASVAEARAGSLIDADDVIDFSTDEQSETRIIHSVWGARRGRGPTL